MGSDFHKEKSIEEKNSEESNQKIVIDSLEAYVKYISDINKIENNQLIEELIESMRDSKNYSEDEITDLESFKVFREYVSKINKGESSDKKKKFIEKDTYGRPEGRFFYRGQYNANYKPLPGIYRDNNLQLEDYFYHEIMVRCPDKFKDLNHLDRLVVMQHYGVPTRLLDITSNPLVALYFACKNYGCKKCDDSELGIVYIFFTNSRNVLYSDSDKALMLSCLPQFSYEDKYELFDATLYELKNNKGSFSKGANHQYKDATVERFYHEISRELPSFKREINPFDLLNPVVVQPPKSNSRILKQDGAFIFVGLNKNALEAEIKLRCMTSQKVYINRHEEILKELDQMGINEATLFPEMNNVADYLKWRVKQ